MSNNVNKVLNAFENLYCKTNINYLPALFAKQVLYMSSNMAKHDAA